MRITRRRPDPHRRRRPVSPAAVAVLSWLLLAAGAGTTSAGGHVPGQAHVSHRTPEASRVGALFHHGLADGHFCTASVVDSPGRSLLVTAAHCLDDGADGITFAPGYRDGSAPYGVWRISAVYVDRHWANDSDEDYDVAFAVVAPLDGRRLGDTVGGNHLGLNPGNHRRVRLTGYPDSSDQPLSCVNTASRFGSGQLRIDCTDYSLGTSGSPWVTDVDRSSHIGTVIGVIGGHQQGGATDEVSYSSYFGSRVGTLYRRAVASGG
ncbi:trypsin-like serine peptidase [Peterkaempfera sp. SMS 1(5)a]|uniref:trypsin-like serine peptidase n=1 Tax=Peterkaempfera podocarpi TaxID=3232308 RepID=UPI00366E35FC